MTINERSSLGQRSRDLAWKAVHIFLCLNLFISMLFLAVPSFKAESYIYVDTTADELITNGECSLREAIQAANTNTAVDTCDAGAPGFDVINLPVGIFVLSITGSDDDTNATGDLDVTEDLMINGASMDTTIIEGGTDWDDRIIDVPDEIDDAKLSLVDLALRNGEIDDVGGGLRFVGNELDLVRVRINDNHSTDDGGGVYFEADYMTEIRDSFFHDNSCTGLGCDGGGVFAMTDLILDTVEIYQNSAQDEGGGVYFADPAPSSGIIMDDSAIRSNQADLGGGISTSRLIAERSEISNNSAIVTANGMGGGIYHWGAGQNTLSNITLSGNEANSDGGGLCMVGTGSTLINNSTITDNEADADSVGMDYGGGIYFDSSTGGVGIANSIVAENLVGGVVNADHADCTNNGSTLYSYGYNLQGLRSSTLDCDFNDVNDTQGSVASPTDPHLGPLQDNGGLTNTHALLPLSPAIEGGNTNPPDGTLPECMAEDQRGISRPQDTYCDMGAFELVPNSPPNMPSNPDPANAAEDVSIFTDQVSWDGGDPDGDPVTYDVYFEASETHPSVLICDDISDTTCDLPELAADTSYYWSVEAFDGEDTTIGPVWRFATQTTAPVELLRNVDLEIVAPSGWKGSNLETVDGSDCSVAHGGSCSAALTGASGGETKMLFYGLPGFSGSAGDTFHLSYWNRRDGVGGAGAVQVRVSIRYTDATMGHFSYVPGVGTADWALFEEDFTAAKDYDWGVVRLIFSKPDGTLWYDDMSLERNGSEELLNNNDMELRVPSMWKGANLVLVDGADCTEAQSGTCSAALTGTGGETKMLFYGIPGFSGSAGDNFHLSYYNKRQDVGGAGAVQVRVSIRYTDATMGHFSFVPGVGTADWLLFEEDFTAAKDYDWGVIRLIFSKPNGTLWYDDISLMR